MEDDRFTMMTGGLLAAGGAAGYLAGRWVFDRWHAWRGSAARDAARAQVAVAAAPTQDQPSSAPPEPLAIPLPRRFDHLFEDHRGGIPIEYLRALAMRESGMRAGEQTGPAWGLMQIVEAVRHEYNRAHGTALEREDLLDPAINVAIATWLLRTIIRSYQRNHPQVANLQPDWSNPRFVELLTLGWNAGYSEHGGVGRVARFLEARGSTELTVDLVHDHAAEAGASRHVARANKVAWSKSVAALYERERKLAASATSPSGSAA